MSATLFALSLLSAGPGDVLPLVLPADWPAVRDALISQAVEWEILDPRENRLRRYEELAGDLELLRVRRRELAGAPHLADCQRLPPRAAVEEMLSFNRAYRRSLERRAELEFDRAGDLREAIRETDRLYRIWEAVRDAQCDVYFVSVRRAALLRLQQLLGPPAYLAQQLPPHVPIWRFVEIK